MIPVLSTVTLLQRFITFFWFQNILLQPDFIVALWAQFAFDKLRFFRCGKGVQLQCLNVGLHDSVFTDRKSVSLNVFNSTAMHADHCLAIFQIPHLLMWWSTICKYILLVKMFEFEWFSARCISVIYMVNG